MSATPATTPPESLVTTAGDFVYIPRGTVHRFKNVGVGMAVQLVTFSPAGIEGFIQEVFPEVKDRKAAPPPVTEELIRKMNEGRAKSGAPLNLNVGSLAQRTIGYD